MAEKDIFDKIMELPGFRFFNTFYMKHKEALLYLFFGGLTTIISISVYGMLNVFFEMNELVANVLSWIISVAFAFLTNRVWVFYAPTNSLKEFFGQALSFYAGRILTLVVEEVILFIFISYLQFNSLVVKVIAQIVVIVHNYIISKIWSSIRITGILRDSID